MRRRAIEPPLRDDALQDEEFVVGEPLPRFLFRLERLGKMDDAERLLARQHLFRRGIKFGRDEGNALRRLEHEAAQDTLGQPLGEVVDGRDPVDVDVRLGVVMRDFIVGLVHHPAALFVAVHLAVDEDVAAFLDAVGAIGVPARDEQVVAAAQGGRADRDLKPERTPVHSLGRMDLSPHRDGLPVLRLAHGLEMTAVLVTARHVMEQVVVREESDLAQQLGVPRPDAVDGGKRGWFWGGGHLMFIA